MSKLNLSEAAAEILQQSKAKAGAEPFGVGNAKATKAKVPQQGEVELGTAGHKTTDANYDGTKGMGAQATLPTGRGVAPEPMKKLSGQPQQSQGRPDLAGSPEGSETSETDKVNGKKGPSTKETFPANPKAVKPFVPEAEEDEEDWEPEDEEEYEEEELEEATMEEVQRDLKKLDDKTFAKKYGMPKKAVVAKLQQMQQKDSVKEEATVEEVMEDLEEMDDEDFEYKYGLSKEDAVEHISENYVKPKDFPETSYPHPAEKPTKEFNIKKGGKKKFSHDEYMPTHKAEKGMTYKEDVDAMLSGENLSEEFKEKASMIFEAAVEARVEEIASELEEQFTQEFEESLELVKEDFAEKLDSYLDYVVENWMQENELAIEKGLRSEIVEDFIGALRNVFVEHYIDIPEEKVEIVEELVEKVEELEEQVNEQILKNIELKKSLSEQKKVEVIHSVCEGLSLSQVEKIKSLAKNVEFVSEEDFEDKLEAIKESYFPSGVISASTESLNEALEFDEDDTTEVVDPLIKAYANKISKNTKF